MVPRRGSVPSEPRTKALERRCGIVSTSFVSSAEARVLSEQETRTGLANSRDDIVTLANSFGRKGVEACELHPVPHNVTFHLLCWWLNTLEVVVMCP